MTESTLFDSSDAKTSNNTKTDDSLLDIPTTKSELFPEDLLNLKEPQNFFQPNKDFEENENLAFHTAPLFNEMSYLNASKIDKSAEKDIFDNNSDRNHRKDNGKSFEKDSDSEYDKETESSSELEDNEQMFEEKLDGLCLSPKEPKKKKKEIKKPLKREYKWAKEELNKNCSEDFEKIEDKVMKFDFELDDFQKQGILHLEKGESVFVAAHTSAGKTVIAEYAIALSMKNMTRAIYTSPIKTLSNQKFRDFKKTFGKVGIITGDVSINPEASCLILTTEILRSLLHKGSDVIKDIEWVIFDEVHYINDYERGVVWEEVIIMLPESVNIIMLSATVPNALEFADWVGSTKHKKIFVINTKKRPVPLQHSIWYENKLFKIMDEEKFDENVFNRIETWQKRIAERKKSKKPDRYFQRMRKMWEELIYELKTTELLPAVVFVFSKKRCDNYSNMMSRVNFNNKTDRRCVQRLLDTAFKRLSMEDKRLPQIKKMQLLLSNGIGVHHAGMLPIVREVVEMCFCRGYVKLLYATETFAVGVNMPARTVIFEDYNKHDGRSFRNLTSAEYIQMSGRAGRRGIDTYGTVIVIGKETVLDDKLELARMLKSPPASLISKFRVTYNMILNLFKSEDVNVEQMIKMSFDQFHLNAFAPEQKNLLEKNKKRLETLINSDEESIGKSLEDYISTYEIISHQLKRFTQYMFNSNSYKSSFSIGRVIIIKKPNSLYLADSIILDTKLFSDVEARFLVLTFVPEEWELKKENLNFGKELKKFAEFKYKSKYVKYIIAEIGFSDIYTLTINKFPMRERLPKKKEEISEKIIKKIYKKIKTKKDSAGKLFRAKDLGEMIREKDICITDSINDFIELEKHLESLEVHDNLAFIQKNYSKVSERIKLEEEVLRLNNSLSENNIPLVKVFEKKVLVLQELNYVDKNRSILLKGNVAREVNNCESLILTELVFNNFLKDLEPEETLSLLSCLIFTYKTKTEPRLTPILADALMELKRVALRIGSIQEHFGVPMIAADFLKENVNEGIMEVVYRWAQGEEFYAICKVSDAQEGVIVRNIVRLDETCRDIKKAAQVMGDPDLCRKMEVASSLIKRDIVFTPSLYLT